MNELRTFQTVAEMNAFYRDLFKRRDRLRKPPARPKPKPVVVTVTAPIVEPVSIPVTVIIDTRPPGTVITIPDLGRIVMKQVAIVFELSIEMLTSQRRFTSFAQARQAGYFITRKLGGASLSQLGRIFKRDHSTVLHGWRMAAKRRFEKPEYGQKIEWVIDRVRHVVVVERKQIMPPELTDEEVVRVGFFPKQWSKHESQASADDCEASA